jgi:hypothetical protein
LYFERVDSEVRNMHPASTASTNKNFRYFQLIKATKNSRITTKLKAGPFLANKMINAIEDANSRFNKILSAFECFRVNKIIGLAKRRISDVPAARGFSEKRKISPE